MGLALKGAEYLQDWAGEKSKDLTKAMQVSLSRTLYDLRTVIKKDLEVGRLGLKALSPYRNEPGDPKYSYSKKEIRKMAKWAPLQNISGGITYYFNKNRLYGEIGFGALPFTGDWQTKIASKSRTGYSMPITENIRETLHRRGIHLKKNTVSISVPSRDIIGSASNKYAQWALNKLKEYFDIKKAGGRF